MSNMKYSLTVCYWCKKEMNQRCDTYKRQIEKYGHSCCKHCFGKENTFREVRKRVMTENNPFKGKVHSEESRKIISKKAIGRKAWNKGFKKRKPPIVPGSVRKWMEFKKVIIERDKNCWKCGSTNRIEVHHMASKKRFPDYHYDELNCITLCYWCHKEFHNRFTRLKFTVGDTHNWLNEGRQPHEYVNFH